MTAYVVAIDGLEALTDIDDLDERVISNARKAINRTLDKARTAASREIRQQVAFSARRLDSGKLKVTQRPFGNTLQGIITGTDDPTSLARFVTSNRKKGVDVRVSPGQTKTMDSAFLMSLKNGNQGLAIRLKEGETIRNKKSFLKRVEQGLYLLYGPAVNQVFKGVADDMAPEVARDLEIEFLRLMDL